MAREAAIVRGIVEDVKRRPGVFVRKNHGGFGIAGIPDLEIIFRDPTGRTRVVYLEVKNERGVVSAVQAARIAELAKAGADVEVVRTRKEAVSFLESLGIPGRFQRGEHHQRRSGNDPRGLGRGEPVEGPPEFRSGAAS